MRSNKPIAQKFQEVVCEEILPNLRKNKKRKFIVRWKENRWKENRWKENITIIYCLVILISMACNSYTSILEA